MGRMIFWTRDGYRYVIALSPIVAHVFRCLSCPLPRAGELQKAPGGLAFPQQAYHNSQVLHNSLRLLHCNQGPERC